MHQLLLTYSPDSKLSFGYGLFYVYSMDMLESIGYKRGRSNVFTFCPKCTSYNWHSSVVNEYHVWFMCRHCYNVVMTQPIPVN